MGVLKTKAYGMEVRKLTDWYMGNQKPKRVGVYQRDYGNERLEDDIVFCLWNGKKWLAFGKTPNEAAESSSISIDQGAKWRGLADKP